ncbi:MAG: hypothetical protein QF724_01865 [Planctomycetota bacterium]|nr:hypothetical protein [Planctomycetota bacterium]MDP6837659.1 hypothetical protein [Planctomycetota bacterium]
MPFYNRRACPPNPELHLADDDALPGEPIFVMAQPPIFTHLQPRPN